jgi:hypothetical protein
VRSIFPARASLITVLILTPLLAASFRVSAAPLEEEAVRSLKALRSVTRIGVSFRDYLPRLHDTAIAVDRYLDAQHSPTALPRLVKRALKQYTLAARAWEAKNSDVPAFASALRGDNGDCPALRALLDRTLDEWRVRLDESPEGRLRWQTIQLSLRISRSGSQADPEQMRKIEQSEADRLAIESAVDALWQCASRTLDEIDQTPR